MELTASAGNSWAGRWADQLNSPRWEVLDGLPPSSDPIAVFPQAEPAYDAAVDLWALPTACRTGGFDSLVRRVVDDGEPTFVLPTPDANRVYAPYDGAADLFL